IYGEWPPEELGRKLEADDLRSPVSEGSREPRNTRNNIGHQMRLPILIQKPLAGRHPPALRDPVEFSKCIGWQGAAEGGIAYRARPALGSLHLLLRTLRPASAE